ncbi:uncharacterized protein N7484_010578 [Penicillium longicatenatum]|uniref:uncharacterized protein n=1 Tax=Penicillium longicatenatum TaxID=1561947 RepID=UPI002547F026|nr:uncharacterized protein N7484_010578 [Penicillium longicatenatum]KAJ5630478.1 hypothetical protein N7484_010578 [Penicillium longicatenatum]
MFLDFRSALHCPTHGKRFENSLTHKIRESLTAHFLDNKSNEPYHEVVNGTGEPIDERYPWHPYSGSAGYSGGAGEGLPK